MALAATLPALLPILWLTRGWGELLASVRLCLVPNLVESVVGVARGAYPPRQTLYMYITTPSRLDYASAPPAALVQLGN